MTSMYTRFCLFLFLVFVFSCKEDEFNAGLENRVTAIIDMVPESYNAKIDFISDAQISDCPDHDVLTIDQLEDGSLDNKIYRITLEAKDYFRSENNCNDYDWSTSENEALEHELVITAFAEQIDEKMYIKGSPNVFHPDESTNSMVAYYKLTKDSDGNDNDGNGIEYIGFDAEIELEELNFSEGTVSGFFNATLYRGTYVANPSDFVGVEVSSNVDLFNPFTGDPTGNVENGIIDSIRIENGVFQRITLINNISQ